MLFRAGIYQPQSSSRTAGDGKAAKPISVLGETRCFQYTLFVCTCYGPVSHCRTQPQCPAPPAETRLIALRLHSACFLTQTLISLSKLCPAFCYRYVSGSIHTRSSATDSATQERAATIVVENRSTHSSGPSSWVLLVQIYCLPRTLVQLSANKPQYSLCTLWMFHNNYKTRPYSTLAQMTFGTPQLAAGKGPHSSGAVC